MRLLSHEAKLSASQALRMPPMLVPTPCSSLCRQPTAYQPQAGQRVSHPRVAASTVAYNTTHAPQSALQAMAIYRLTEGKLRYMAAQLGIALPNTAATRASIIEILTKELDLL